MSHLRDELYDALSNPHRRRLLFDLLEDAPRTDSPRSLETLPPDSRGGKSTRIEYHHVHLPKLEQYGFIDWSSDISCVERGPRFEDVSATLELLATCREFAPASE